jgi:nucleoside-diphosphate-sugar epimerase
MKIFIAGSTGTTGKKLTAQLLERGHHVVTVVRSTSSLPDEIRNHSNLALTRASLLDLSDPQLQDLVKDCDAVASCLGHNLTLKGMYGHPRKLVTDATRRLCQVARANQPQKPVKFVLMNTTGNRNRDLNEPRSFGEKLVVGLLRVLLPPQADNEAAAEYLRTQIGQNDTMIEWVAVRPDGLIDEDMVTEYTIHPSPTRSPIFDAGQTSRINVGHFMAELITDEAIWREWQGQMPVIYNKMDAKE